MGYLSLLFLLILTGCSSGSIVTIDGIEINVEVADTNEEMIKGLMFREELCENCGMLFIFDDSNYRSFWMKNTLIPLDIIFIDENFEIMDIKYAVPCYEDPCRTYDSKEKSKYVLEVNEGFTANNSINIGDKVEIR